MGYAPYPAGCVAFRNDLIRSFILQEAPYVTSAERNTALHVPPRYVKLDADGNRRVVTESFSPFILEGSRPGAAATGLWLAMKCVPYNPRGHGAIVRSTLLSARLLHELLIKSDALSAKPPGAHAVFFVPLLEYGPDTNIVTFTVSSKAFTSLAAMNELTTLVYDTFSIHAELGERAHSYSQPFFLSKTTMNSSHYSSAMLERFFARAGLSNSAGLEYRSEGMVVLRATMMKSVFESRAEFGGPGLLQTLYDGIDPRRGYRLAKAGRGVTARAPAGQRPSRQSHQTLRSQSI